MSEEVATQVIADATIPDPLVEQPAKETPPPSLRDTIKAAVDASKPVEGETEEQRAQRVRDEGGRFTKGKEPKRETLTLKEPKAKPDTDITQPAEESAPVPKTFKPPEMWKGSAKAKFATLDPEIQAEITTREELMHKEITRAGDERAFAKKMREAAAPYEAILRAENTDVETAFKSLMNMSYLMRTGTAETKKKLLIDTARFYNVDLGIPLQSGPVDPTIGALQREVAELRQARQAEIQQRQFQENSVVQTALETFLAEPGHDHFEQLKPAMAALLNSGAAQTYQEAYDKAMWADPDIRSGLLSQQTREAEAKRTAEAKARTDAAKRAAVSVTGGPGGVRPSGPNGEARSLRDELRANLNAAQGRI